MRNLSTILKKAKFGELTDEEFAYVVQKIKESRPGCDEDLCSLLNVLGSAGAVHRKYQLRKLVEGFLYYPTFPMVSGAALDVLCNDWDYAQDYLGLLKSFIKGVEWDPDGDVRIIAISSAGEFLRHNSEKELLQLLVDILEKESDAENDLYPGCAREEETLEKECAYEALARSAGQEWKDLLRDEKPNWPILEKIYQRLKTIG